LAYEIGLKKSEYEDLTWREWLLITEGYSLRNLKEWERTRAIIYTIAAANRHPKKPFPSIQKFMPLATDKVDEERGEKLTQEQLARVIKLYNK